MGRGPRLIREAEADPEIRPTFLSQTPFKVLSFDFRDLSHPTLELSTGRQQVKSNRFAETRGMKSKL